jgi:hypothetical protein
MKGFLIAVALGISHVNGWSYDITASDGNYIVYFERSNLRRSREILHTWGKDWGKKCNLNFPKSLAKIFPPAKFFFL